MKKIIIIISIILGLVALSFGIYFAWKKSQEILTPPPPPEIKPSNPASDQPSLAPKPKMRVISDGEIFDYWLTYSTSSPRIFYVNGDGKIFEAEEEADKLITEVSANDFQSVESSTDGKYILIKSGSLTKPQWSIFDTAEYVWQTIDGAVAAAFSPDSKKLVYLKENGDLIVKDIFSSQATKIISFNQKDFSLRWLSEKGIILTSKPSAYYFSEAWELNPETKTLKKISEGWGLMTRWSNDGKLGVQFATNPQRNDSLNLIDSQGAVVARFTFSSMPDKCFITQPIIYCGVSQSNNYAGTITLPDDYLKRAVHFNDFIYRLDTEKNSMEPIFAEYEPSLDITHLTAFGNQLFFINRYNNKLYSLEFSQ